MTYFYVSVPWLRSKQACSGTLEEYERVFGQRGCDLRNINQATQLVVTVGADATVDLLIVLLTHVSFFYCRDRNRLKSRIAQRLCRHLGLTKTYQRWEYGTPKTRGWDAQLLHRALRNLSDHRLALAVTEIAAAIKENRK